MLNVTLMVDQVSPSRTYLCSHICWNETALTVTPWFLATFSFRNLSGFICNLVGFWTFSVDFGLMNSSQWCKALSILPKSCHSPSGSNSNYSSFPNIHFSPLGKSVITMGYTATYSSGDQKNPKLIPDLVVIILCHNLQKYFMVQYKVYSRKLHLLSGQYWSFVKELIFSLLN